MTSTLKWVKRRIKVGKRSTLRYAKRQLIGQAVCGWRRSTFRRVEKQFEVGEDAFFTVRSGQSTTKR